MSANHSNGPRKSRRIETSINLQAEVLAHLDMIAKRLSMSRSWVLNTIVLEHMRQSPPREVEQPISSSLELRTAFINS